MPYVWQSFQNAARPKIDEQLEYYRDV